MDALKFRVSHLGVLKPLRRCGWASLLEFVTIFEGFLRGLGRTYSIRVLTLKHSHAILAKTALIWRGVRMHDCPRKF